MSTQPDKSELINEIEAVAAGLSHRPRLKDMKEDGGYSAERYYDEFGSWSEALEIAGYDPTTTVNGKVTKEKLIADIQRVADEIGRSPSSAEYTNNGEHSCSVVYRIFDSWGDALEAADLERLNFEKMKQITDKQELIDALRKDKQRLGHVPTRDELNEKGTYTGTTYQNHFGTYNNALKKAGFPINKPDNTLTSVECFCCGDVIQKPEWQIKSRERLFCSNECVQRATVETVCSYCGSKTKIPHLQQNQYENSFCDDSCRAQYYSRSGPAGDDRECDNCGGIFNRYKTVTGDYAFCSRECSHEFHCITEQELVQDYKETTEELGHTPTIEEITEHCQHGVDTFYQNFDSLIDVADAAGVDPPYQCSVEVECDNCGGNFQRKPSRISDDQRDFCDRECYVSWTREGHLRDADERRVPDYGPSWESQRRAARERDNFTCQSCGMTKEEHLEQYKVRPHVHHIRPWHEFDDHEERNKLSNLIVLCAGCHAEWEKLPVNPQLPSQ